MGYIIAYLGGANRLACIFFYDGFKCRNAYG